MSWASEREVIDYCSQEMGLTRIFPRGVYPGEFDNMVNSLLAPLESGIPEYNFFDVEKYFAEIDVHIAQASMYKRQYLEIENAALQFSLDQASRHKSLELDLEALEKANALLELNSRKHAYERASDAFKNQEGDESGHGSLYQHLSESLDAQILLEERRLELSRKRVTVSEDVQATVKSAHNIENGPTDYSSRMERAWRYFAWEMENAYIKSKSLWIGMAEVFQIHDYSFAPTVESDSYFDKFHSFFREMKEDYVRRTKNEIEYYSTYSLSEALRLGTGLGRDGFLERIYNSQEFQVNFSGSLGSRVTGIAFSIAQRAWDEGADYPDETSEVENKSGIRKESEKRAGLGQERRHRELSIDLTPPEWLPSVVPANTDPIRRHFRPVVTGTERLVRRVIPNIPARQFNAHGLQFFFGYPIHNIPIKGEWRVKIDNNYLSLDANSDPAIVAKDGSSYITELEDVFVHFRLRGRTQKSEEASIDVF